MLVRSPTDLASYIANTRKELKLSQTEVGKKVGLKQQTISQFERRPGSTEIATLFRILSSLDLDIKVTPKHTEKLNASKGWKEEW